jgi:ABC-type uncharacterized transport system permease subunit
MLFRRNNINIGIGLGILIPAMIFGFLYAFGGMGVLPLKIRTAALIGICANIFTANMFRKYRANQSLRGVMIATIIISALWLFWFLKEILFELELAND